MKTQEEFEKEHINSPKPYSFTSFTKTEEYVGDTATIDVITLFYTEEDKTAKITFIFTSWKHSSAQSCNIRFDDKSLWAYTELTWIMEFINGCPVFENCHSFLSSLWFVKNLGS